MKQRVSDQVLRVRLSIKLRINAMQTFEILIEVF